MAALGFLNVPGVFFHFSRLVCYSNHVTWTDRIRRWNGIFVFLHKSRRVFWVTEQIAVKASTIFSPFIPFFHFKIVLTCIKHNVISLFLYYKNKLKIF